MAIHTELPIYKKGVDLLALALKAQQQMPRGIKRHLGDKISEHCVAMLDLMALANATKAQERAAHIQAFLARRRAVEVLLRASLEGRYVSLAIWAESIQVLDSLGRQGGGWLKSSTRKPAPAA